MYYVQHVKLLEYQTPFGCILGQNAPYDMLSELGFPRD